MTMRILLVDDDDDVREMLALILESRGHQPIAARDGAEAIARVRDGAVDVVVLDVGLPGMPVEELLRDPVMAATPVVIASGWARVDAEISAGRPVLQKPFRAEALLAAIARATGAS